MARGHAADGQARLSGGSCEASLIDTRYAVTDKHTEGLCIFHRPLQGPECCKPLKRGPGITAFFKKPPAGSQKASDGAADSPQPGSAQGPTKPAAAVKAEPSSAAGATHTTSVTHEPRSDGNVPAVSSNEAGDLPDSEPAVAAVTAAEPSSGPDTVARAAAEAPGRDDPAQAPGAATVAGAC